MKIEKRKKNGDDNKERVSRTSDRTPEMIRSKIIL